MPGREEALNIIERRIAAERDAQIRRFEALDGKAGIVLGFAGVLVGFGSSARPTVTMWLGQLFGVVSALSSMSVVARSYPLLDVGGLRDRLLRTDLQSLVLHLVDLDVSMAGRTSRLLIMKSRTLRIAMAFLILATILLAMGRA